MIGFGLDQAMCIKDLIGDQSGWKILIVIGFFIWSLHANGTLSSAIGTLKYPNVFEKFNKNYII